MLGYIYNNENVAIEARQLAANYKGLPLSPNDVTQYWVNYITPWILGASL